MTLETIDRTQQLNIEYWITYKTESGKISSISKKKPTQLRDGRSTISSTDPCIDDIVSGKINVNDFAVIENVVTGNWDISKKKDELELQPISSKLEEIQKGSSEYYNHIFITVYKKEMKMLLSANEKLISKDYHLSTINSIVDNDFSLMDIFICKKNDPDTLLYTLKVDSATLLKRKSILIDIPHSVTSKVDIEDLSFFCIPLFKKYGISFEEQFIESTLIDKNSKTLDACFYDKNCQINIYVLNDRTLKIKSTLSRDNYNLFEGKEHFILLMCSDSPDNLISGLKIPTWSIVEQEEFMYNLPCKLPKNPLFVYKNKQITVSYNGEDNDKQN